MSRDITAAAREAHTIGELAALSGVRVETIRYFERIGLLSRPQRTAGGHRLFSASDLARLNFVRRAREMGFSQAEVRALMSLSSGEMVACGEVKAMAEHHLAMIRQRIRDLGELEKSLSSTVAQCAGGRMAKCPVIESIATAAPKKASGESANAD
jgi:MerR family mercuric resistance operon transcriptional regulator